MTNHITDEEEDPFTGVVSAVCWAAVRSTYHATLKAMPGQLLVFGREITFINMKQTGNLSEKGS